MKSSPGTLYIVASPIGNLEDFTYRAVRVLKEEVTAVYCEDTRQTRKLLDHYGIVLPLRSLHAHSPAQRTAEAVEKLRAGDSIAYITDSGTPSISDPGSAVVREARTMGLPVVPIPGPTALGAIISVAGFPETTVVFAGFLSKKDSKRKKELQNLREIPGIIVFYESPYRIKKALAAVGEVFPGSEVVVGREMTKFYEEYISGQIETLLRDADTIMEKGEFTVAVRNPRQSSRQSR